MRTALGTGNARLGQTVLFVVFIPINILLWYIVIANFNFSTFLFVILITGLSATIIFLASRIADVSVENGTLFISRLFITTTIHARRLRKIGSLAPLGFYLEFDTGKKVYVLFGAEEIIKQVINSKSNRVVSEIKSAIDKSYHV